MINLFTVAKIAYKAMPKKVWMIQGPLVSCKRKNKPYLKSLKHHTEDNKFNYKKYRNKFKILTWK